MRLRYFSSTDSNDESLFAIEPNREQAELRAKKSNVQGLYAAPSRRPTAYHFISFKIGIKEKSFGQGHACRVPEKQW
jgi:hypothetical protein